eukprot:scaffold5174_cov118-Isochrysis_galbana.AAC.5
MTRGSTLTLERPAGRAAHLLARPPVMAGSLGGVSEARRSSETLSAQFSGVELDAYRQLFNGCRAGDQKTVTSLLAKGMRVNCVGPRGVRRRSGDSGGSRAHVSPRPGRLFTPGLCACVC